MHHTLKLPSQDLRQCHLSRINGTAYRIGIVTRRTPEDVIDHLSCTTRMINTDAQTPKITSTHGADNIPQAIMAGMTSTLLQANGARGQIELIMGHQDLFKGNFKVVCET